MTREVSEFILWASFLHQKCCDIETRRGIMPDFGKKKGFYHLKLNVSERVLKFSVITSDRILMHISDRTSAIFSNSFLTQWSISKEIFNDHFNVLSNFESWREVEKLWVFFLRQERCFISGKRFSSEGLSFRFYYLVFFFPMYISRQYKWTVCVLWIKG